MSDRARSELDLGEGTGVHEEPDSLHVIGNATTVLRCGGITVLTDPVFVHRHEEVDIGYGMSATCLLDPAVEFDDLPPFDVVLLSHLHGDHFDQVARDRLPRSMPVLTTPEAAETLQEWGFHSARGLQTWETVRVRRGEDWLDVTAVPARHGPPGASLVLPDVMGSVLEWSAAGTGRSLYVTGDTLVIDELSQVRQRWPELDVGLWHLGGTRFLGVLVTMDADQGVELLRRVAPHRVVPVHHEDFDVFTSSLDHFLAAADEAGLRDRVAVVPRGGHFLLAPDHETVEESEIRGPTEQAAQEHAATVPGGDLRGLHQQTQPLAPDGTPVPIDVEGHVGPPTEDQLGSGRGRPPSDSG